MYCLGLEHFAMRHPCSLLPLCIEMDFLGRRSGLWMLWWRLCSICRLFLSRRTMIAQQMSPVRKLNLEIMTILPFGKRSEFFWRVFDFTFWWPSPAVWLWWEFKSVIWLGKHISFQAKAHPNWQCWSNRYLMIMLGFDSQDTPALSSAIYFGSVLAIFAGAYMNRFSNATHNLLTVSLILVSTISLIALYYIHQSGKILSCLQE